MPTVDAEARTAASTLAPTTDRTPREESRRAGAVGTGDPAVFGVAEAVQPFAAGGVAVGGGAAVPAGRGASGAGGVAAGSAGRTGVNVGSGVIFDHSVIGALLEVRFGVVTTGKPSPLRRS
jgi:hypothetical protein